MADTNRIIEVKLSLDKSTGMWFVHVRKEFEEQYGGGEQTFSEPGGLGPHRALDVARGMVTAHPAHRTDLDFLTLAEAKAAGYKHVTTVGQYRQDMANPKGKHATGAEQDANREPYFVVKELHHMGMEALVAIHDVAVELPAGDGLTVYTAKASHKLPGGAALVWL